MIFIFEKSNFVSNTCYYEARGIKKKKNRKVPTSTYSYV